MAKVQPKNEKVDFQRVLQAVAVFVGKVKTDSKLKSNRRSGIMEEKGVRKKSL
ncbi:MAG: hypothetical protein LBB24_03425 [Rickettsiales bacterium]|jgi:hypothetical protein|nr:hypothetical protein [Rickettsiales bacterium]